MSQVSSNDSTIAGAWSALGAMFSIRCWNVHAPPGPVRTGSSTTLRSRISSSLRERTEQGVPATEYVTDVLKVSKTPKNANAWMLIW